MARIPKKLRHDSIADAICEIRFDCEENREAPEVVVGVLASNPLWKTYRKRRLPEADIPQQIRRADPNLVSRPLLELSDENGTRRLLLGTHSIATIRSRPYPGWPSVQNEIREISEYVFSAFANVTVFRLGLRYLNVLEKSKHSISSMHDLNFSVKINSETLNGELNLNYLVLDKSFKSTVRIATPGFINNMTPVDGLGVIDIDTETTSVEEVNSPEATQGWFDLAHDFEKGIFFGLFTEKQLEGLVDEWN